jgi:hypothetical protein
MGRFTVLLKTYNLENYFHKLTQLISACYVCATLQNLLIGKTDTNRHSSIVEFFSIFKEF